jgi:SNF2 family DNA or RNA helicase
MSEALIRVVKDHIIFPTGNIEKVKAMFPEVLIGEVNGQSMCAVPHTINATRLFRNAGKEVPTPLVTKYPWPGRFTPYEHQVTTAEFLALNMRAYCLSGMGTGKTNAALWATDYLMKANEVGKTIICAPLSTLDRVWAHEIFQTLPHRTYRILHGSRERRRSMLEDDVDFFIINHDGLAIISDLLATRDDINHFILDELAVYRNAQTKRWKLMFELLNRQGIARSVWGLTGTPTPNAPTDAYGQAKLITPENCRGSFRKFRDETMNQITQYKWVPRAKASEKVNETMQPSVRYALEDCIDLPETIHQDRDAPLTSMQRKAHDDLVREAVTMVGEEQVTAVNAGVLLNKIVQAACGVMYGPDGSVLELDFGPRLNLLKEVIEECNEKVIVFVPLTGALRVIEKELSKDWSVGVVDGSVSPNKRNEIFRKFQMEDSPHVILANAGTMAHGLTLTAASTIVWYAPVHSNEIYQQANARIVRPGQTKVTNIVHIQATSTERKIYAKLRDRGRMQDIVLDLAKER